MKSQRESVWLAESKREEGKCSHCKLAAVCLPVGPELLVKRMWQCGSCKGLFLGEAKGNQLTVNGKCYPLYAALVEVDGKRKGVCARCAMARKMQRYLDHTGGTGSARG